LEHDIAEDEEWLRLDFGLDLRPDSAKRQSTALTEENSSQLTKQLGLSGRGWLRVALFARGAALGRLVPN
jgi:hypothetical protein